LTRTLRTAAFFLLVFAVWLSPAPARAVTPPTASLSGTVTWVYDADTLNVDPYGKVRLLGIDSPEKTASTRDLAFTRLGIAPGRLRPVHGEGLAWAIRNVKGQKVTLVLDQSERDRHGRLLAYVHLADGRLVNRLLLEEGLVIVYRRFNFERKADFLAAEAAARGKATGLWSH
jgi:micrococcal nuclease